MVRKKSKTIVSVIIVDYCIRQFLFECLASLIRTQLPEILRGEIEIIFVGNGLAKSEVTWLVGFKDRWPVTCLYVQQGNPSKARNVGAAAASGDLLLFLDSDTELSSGWFGNLVDFMERETGCGAGQLKLLQAGSDLIFDSAGDLVTNTGFLVERARSSFDAGQFDEAAEIFSGKGAALVFRTRLFRLVGGFDERFVYYWEEPDILWRIRKTGASVLFVWSVIVFHKFGTSTKPISDRQRLMAAWFGARNQVWTIFKNGVGARRFLMLLLAIASWLVIACSFLVKGQFNLAMGIVRGLVESIFALPTMARQRIALKRTFSESFDDEIWWSGVLSQRSVNWYFGKAWHYILGKPF